jgi:hypothetical protein
VTNRESPSPKVSNAKWLGWPAAADTNSVRRPKTAEQTLFRAGIRA